MIRVKVNNLNPYEAAKIMLSSNEIRASMNSEMMKVGGNLEVPILQYILNLEHSSISNEVGDEQEENESSHLDETPSKLEGRTKKIIRKGHNSTEISANLSEDSKNYAVNTVDVKPFQIWRIDFGEPLGHEFGFKHYAIVYHGCENSPGTYVVFPTTSKYNRSNRLHQINLSEKNVLEIDEDFRKKSDGVTTYVLLEKREEIDICRFKKCVGMLSKEAVDELMKAIKAVEKDEEKKSLQEYNKHFPEVNEIKKEKSKESLELTAKQEKIIEEIGFVDALTIANNGNYTYGKKVEALLGRFGLPVVGDGIILIDLIKITKTSKSFDLDRMISIIGSKKRYKDAKNKLETLMKKRFNNKNFLYDFVLLINKLAS